MLFLQVINSFSWVMFTQTFLTGTQDVSGISMWRQTSFKSDPGVMEWKLKKRDADLCFLPLCRRLWCFSPWFLLCEGKKENQESWCRVSSIKFRGKLFKSNWTTTTKTVNVWRMFLSQSLWRENSCEKSKRLVSFQSLCRSKWYAIKRSLASFCRLEKSCSLLLAWSRRSNHSLKESVASSHSSRQLHSQSEFVTFSWSNHTRENHCYSFLLDYSISANTTPHFLYQNPRWRHHSLLDNRFKIIAVCEEKCTVPLKIWLRQSRLNDHQ
jgi:hypothetical protein